MPAWKSCRVMEPSDMNTFSQLLHTLLGIGTEPKELTFLQVSVRGIIVFVATLIMVRLGSKRSLAEKTAFDAVFVVIIGSMLARAINGLFSHAGRRIHPGVTTSAFRYGCGLLESWLKENQWLLCRTAGCSAKTCFGNTFPDTISKKICGSMRKRKIYQKYKLSGLNAAETSALSKRIASSSRRHN